MHWASAGRRYGADPAAPPPLVIDAFDALEDRLPKIGSTFVVGLDLRAISIDWAAVDTAGTTFAGCRVSATDEHRLRSHRAVVLPPLDDVGFDPYRARLYSIDDLMAGYVPGRPQTTLDARIGEIARLAPTPLRSLARGVHDTATALGIAWPSGMRYSDLIPTLDPHKPAHEAFLQQAAGTLRGAGYAVIDGRQGPAARPRCDRGSLRARHRDASAPRRPLRERGARRLVRERQAE